MRPLAPPVTPTLTELGRCMMQKKKSGGVDERFRRSSAIISLTGTWTVEELRGVCCLRMSAR